jgi:hypothetical protein
MRPITKARVMKILIEDQGSGKFAESAHTWTVHPEQAMRFANAMEAMEFCARHGMGSTRVVLKFEDSRFDVALRTRRFPWILHPTIAGVPDDDGQHELLSFAQMSVRMRPYRQLTPEAPLHMGHAFWSRATPFAEPCS